MKYDELEEKIYWWHIGILYSWIDINEKETQTFSEKKVVSFIDGNRMKQHSEITFSLKGIIYCSKT